MGVKLDYDINTNVTPWRVTHQQTHSYEGVLLPEEAQIRSLYVIAPDKVAATFWAEEQLNGHGDIFDILAVEPVISDPVHLAYDSYLPEGEEYYVIYSHVNVYRGPFACEHQAEKYAKGIDKRHNPRVVVDYKEDNDE